MGPNVPIYDGVIRHTTDTLCYMEYVYVINVRNIGNKGWWASTGLGKTPRSRYRGGFAPPNPPPVNL